MLRTYLPVVIFVRCDFGFFFQKRILIFLKHIFRPCGDEHVVFFLDIISLMLLLTQTSLITLVKTKSPLSQSTPLPLFYYTLNT